MLLLSFTEHVIGQKIDYLLFIKMYVARKKKEEKKMFQKLFELNKKLQI